MPLQNAVLTAKAAQEEDESIQLLGRIKKKEKENLRRRSDPSGSQRESTRSISPEDQVTIKIQTGKRNNILRDTNILTGTLG